METRRSLFSRAVCTPIICLALSAMAHAAGQQVYIIGGSEHAAVGEMLAEFLNANAGVSAIPVSDKEAIEEGTWRLKETYAKHSGILLGNVHDNQALIQLAAKCLAPASSLYPEPGKYSLQFLQSPLRRGANLVLVAASDSAGIDAGVRRLIAISGQRDIFSSREMPRLPESKTTPARSRWKDFPDAAYDAYWYGNEAAAEAALTFLRTELASRPPKDGLWGFRTGDHYSWERYYGALRQFLSIGYVDEPVRQEINRRLVINATQNTDGFAVSALKENLEQITKSLNRHLLTAFVGMYLVYDYLVRCADLDEATLADLRPALADLENKIRYFLKSGVSRGSTTGPGDLDVMSNLSGLYWNFGDRSAINTGIFDRMARYYVASVDNLGYEAGRSPYLSSRPGHFFGTASGGNGVVSTLFFQNDPVAHWLRKNFNGWREGYLNIQPPPGGWWTGGELPPEMPEDSFGVKVVPLDPVYKKGYGTFLPTTDWMSYKGSPDQISNLIFFRDGFSEKDAYLLVEGLEFGGIKMREGSSANAVIRWTEAGSLLLFQNSQKHDSWSRSVVSSSRGKKDAKSAASRLDVLFNSATMAASSTALDEDGGGNRWSRHIFRKKNEYFLILDELTPLHDDFYKYSCRWRSFHPGTVEKERTFRGTDPRNGTEFFIRSSESLAPRLNHGPRDGAGRPYVLTQNKELQRTKGEKIFFENVLYANAAGRKREVDIRRYLPGIALIKRRDDVSDPKFALHGVNGVQNFDGVDIKARIFSFDENELIAASVESLSLPHIGRMEFSRPVESVVVNSDGILIKDSARQLATVTYAFNVKVDGELNGQPITEHGETLLSPGEHPLRFSGGDLLGSLQTKLAEAWKQSTIPPADQRKDIPQGKRLREVATIGNLPRPPKELNSFRISSDLKFTQGTAEMLNDRLISRYQSAGWNRAGQGNVTLSFPKTVKLSEILFIGSRLQVGGFPTPDDWIITVEGSNDHFQEDIRDLPFTSAQIPFFVENSHYTNTYHYAALRLTGDFDATQFRIRFASKSPSKETRLLFHEIQTFAADEWEEANVHLQAIPDSTSSAPFAVWNPMELWIADSKGTVASKKTFAAPLCRVALQLRKNQPSPSIATYSLDDVLSVWEPDGTVRRHDFFSDDGKSADRIYVTTKPAALAFVNFSRSPEIVWTPHFAVMSQTLSTKQSIHRFDGLGGKVIFPVPNDGKILLGLAGTYGDEAGNLSIVDWENFDGKNQPPILANQPLTGFGSGNSELDRFYQVRLFPKGKETNLLILNPGGMDFFTFPDLERRWSHFSHCPNTAGTLLQSNSQAPALAVAREDGFVYLYDLESGKLLRSAPVGNGIRDLESLGGNLIVGTEDGLYLLSDDLSILERHPGVVDALLSSGNQLIVGFSDGKVSVFSID